MAGRHSPERLDCTAARRARCTPRGNVSARPSERQPRNYGRPVKHSCQGSVLRTKHSIPRCGRLSRFYILIFRCRTLEAVLHGLPHGEGCMRILPRRRLSSTPGRTSGHTIHRIRPDADVRTRLHEPGRWSLDGKVPMERLGEPEEIASVILFLAPEVAFITGAELRDATLPLKLTPPSRDGRQSTRRPAGLHDHMGEDHEEGHVYWRE